MSRLSITQEQLEKLRPLVEKIMVSFQREKPTQATIDLAEFLAAWLELKVEEEAT